MEWHLINLSLRRCHVCASRFNYPNSKPNSMTHTLIRTHRSESIIFKLFVVSFILSSFHFISFHFGFSWCCQLMLLTRQPFYYRRILFIDSVHLHLMWCVKSIIIIIDEVLIDDAIRWMLFTFVYHFCCHCRCRIFSPLVDYVWMLFCIPFVCFYFVFVVVSFILFFSIFYNERMKILKNIWGKKNRNNDRIVWKENKFCWRSHLLYIQIFYYPILFLWDSCHARMYAQISLWQSQVSAIGQYLSWMILTISSSRTRRKLWYSFLR